MVSKTKLRHFDKSPSAKFARVRFVVVFQAVCRRRVFAQLMNGSDVYFSVSIGKLVTCLISQNALAL